MMINFWNAAKHNIKKKGFVLAAKDFIVGNIRNYLYYCDNPLRRLMNSHIREQISLRIILTNTNCYENGSCQECGCTIPNLLMCDSPCEGNCYVQMKDYLDWYFLKKEHYPKIETLFKNTKRDIRL